MSERRSQRRGSVGPRVGWRGGTPVAPRQKRAFSVFAGRVETGGEGAHAEFLARLFQIDPERDRYVTHRFHPYAARVPPSLAAAALARYAPAERGARAGGRPLLWDPFCGSGTVLIEAMLRGLPAGGSDASTLALSIAEVRTNPLDPARREHLVELGEALGQRSAERAMRRERLPELPGWVAGERSRFEPHVLLELLGLRATLEEAEGEGVLTDRDIARALWLSLSSILVKWSREAGPAGAQARPAASRGGGRFAARADEEGEPAQGRRIGRGVPSRFFARRVRELAVALSELEHAAPGAPAPRLRRADARALDGLGAGDVPLVVTSPPYPGVYDYARLHETRYRFLGLDLEGFARAQIGAPDGHGTHSRAFERDRAAFMAELARVLAPGGHLLLVVGDGVLDGRPEDARARYAEVAEAVGLSPVAFASQARPPRDARLREVFAGHPRREHVLLFTRPAASRGVARAPTSTGPARTGRRARPAR